MVIDLTIIAKYLPLAQIAGLMVAGLALVAGVVWLVALLFQVLLEGLKLLIDTFNQLSTISNANPVLHFIFLLGVLCVILRMVLVMFGTLKTGVRNGRI